MADKEEVRQKLASLLTDSYRRGFKAGILETLDMLEKSGTIGPEVGKKFAAELFERKEKKTGRRG